MTPSTILPYIGKTVTLYVHTTPKLTGGKKNHMQGHIVKKSIVTGQILGNDDYQKIMEQIEPGFVPQKRTWGTRTPEGLIEHKGTYYIMFHVHEAEPSEYFFMGQPIDEENIVGLVKRKTDQPIVIATYKLDSIDGIETVKG